MRFRCAERRGFALVFALWIALLLGVAGTVVTRLSSADAGAARIEADLAAARSAAEGGIWYAAHQLAAREISARPPRSRFTIALGGAGVVVDTVDEDGRIDLNTAPEPLIAAMFQAAGLEEPAARQLASRVLDWRDPLSSLRPRTAGTGGGGPRRQAFVTANELALIPGVGLALAEALEGAVTVHTNSSYPAWEAAPPAVQAILQHAAGEMPDRQAQAGRPGNAASMGSRAGRRMIWRIRSSAQRGAVTAHVDAVVMLAPNAGTPGRILMWRGASRADG
ncbi:general secretion pathway protein GspK [Roseomonas sp. SSH11]|uniref:General secretion pathway protein GspK n=1 Tax=Pararoseomonas baculiformis TaxID=2820812 RepID=A0ABS4AC20_9PROT|nr:type II secretion system protein GspK [Pararoseomonas baculiformis]MBP0444560.1 general secretion pathway protein GspK [Pararoseomonas baculiformis]